MHRSINLALFPKVFPSFSISHAELKKFTILCLVTIYIQYIVYHSRPQWRQDQGILKEEREVSPMLREYRHPKQNELNWTNRLADGAARLTKNRLIAGNHPRYMSTHTHTHTHTHYPSCDISFLFHEVY